MPVRPSAIASVVVLLLLGIPATAGAATTPATARTTASPAAPPTGTYRSAPLTVRVSRLTMTERPAASLGDVRARMILPRALAGRGYQLEASGTAGTGVPDRNAFGQKITCADASNRIVAQSWSGTNTLNAEGGATVRNRLLFVPPRTGRYVCSLRAYVNSHTLQPATQMLRSARLAVTRGAIPPRDLRTASPRTANTHVVANRTYAIYADSFRPRATTRSVSVRASLYITSCYGGGGAGCPRGSFPRTGEAVYSLRHVLIPANRACLSVRTPERTYRVSVARHHLGHHVDLTGVAPRGRAVGACGTWRTVTYLTKKPGLTFGLHAGAYAQLSWTAR